MTVGQQVREYCEVHGLGPMTSDEVDGVLVHALPGSPELTISRNRLARFWLALANSNDQAAAATVPPTEEPNEEEAQEEEA